MADRDTLLERAREARELAYAPHSDFPVGAALAYPLGVCAERNAVTAAVVAGRRRFRTLALSFSGSDPKPPCGGCCQVLAEFTP